MSTASIRPAVRGPSPAPVGARRERKLRRITQRLNAVLARRAADETAGRWSRQFIVRNTRRLARVKACRPPFIVSA